MVQAISERIRDTTNAGTAINLDTQRVWPGEFWIVYSTSIHNNSGEAVIAQLGIVRGGDFIAITQKAAALADGDALAGPAFQFILSVGEQVRAIITGTANKGKVTMLVTGVRVDEIPPGEVRGRGQGTYDVKIPQGAAA